MDSVTLDSNTYISALNYGGPPLQILNQARRGELRLDISDAILEEFGGVLRDKFHWSDQEIADVQEEILSFANHVRPVEAVQVVNADADDNLIVACAAEAGSDYHGFSRR